MKSTTKKIFLFTFSLLIFIADALSPISLAALYVVLIAAAYFLVSRTAAIVVISFSLLLVILEDSISFFNIELASKYAIILLAYTGFFYTFTVIKKYQNSLKEKEKLIKNIFYNILSKNDEVFKSYKKTPDSKDYYIKSHANNVAEYAKEIAKQIKCSRNEVELIYKAAYLHDLGKLCVSPSILNKPGVLNPEEWVELKQLITFGSETLLQIPCMKNIARIIKYQYERFDGKGFPEGLKGNQIPLASRVIAVADSFDSMVSNRPHHKAFSISEAVKEIESNKGTQFDPGIVEAFLKVLELKGLIGRKVFEINECNKSHAILFYENRIHLFGSAEEIIQDSLARKRKTICCFDDVIRYSLKKKFKKEVLSRQLELFTSAEYIKWYGEDPSKDLKKNLISLFTEDFKKQYNGLTIIGDAMYISKEIGFKTLLSVEKFVCEAIGELPVLAICMYTDDTQMDSTINSLILDHTHEIRNSKVFQIKYKDSPLKK